VAEEPATTAADAAADTPVAGARAAAGATDVFIFVAAPSSCVRAASTAALISRTMRARAAGSSKMQRSAIAASHVDDGHRIVAANADAIAATWLGAPDAALVASTHTTSVSGRWPCMAVSASSGGNRSSTMAAHDLLKARAASKPAGREAAVNRMMISAV